MAKSGELVSAVRRGEPPGKTHASFLPPKATSSSISLVVAALVAYSLFKVFGPRALLMFVVRCMVRGAAFQSVNYLEHYGLERRQLSEDPNLPAERYELRAAPSLMGLARPARLLRDQAVVAMLTTAAAGKRFQQRGGDIHVAPTSRRLRDDDSHALFLKSGLP